MLDLFFIAIANILSQLVRISIGDLASFDAVLTFGNREWCVIVLAFFAAGFLLYRRWQKPTPRRMQFIYFLFPMLLSTAVLASAVIYFLGPLLTNASFNIPTDILLVMFVAAAVSSVAEEVLYRGVLLHHLVKIIWPAAAVIITVIIFCMMHDKITIFLVVFAMAFAISYIITGSLMGSICTHFLFNLAIFICKFPKTHGNIDKITEGALGFLYFGLLLSILLGLCTGIIVYLLARRRQNKSNNVAQVLESTLDCVVP